MLRRLTVAVVLAVVALFATTAMTAHAARLGGAAGVTVRKLYAMSQGAQDALPALLAADNFDGGVDNLAGQGSDTGQLWSVVVGTLNQSTNALRCTSCTGGNYGVGLIDAFRPNGTVTVDLTPTAGTVGVVLDADAALSHVVVAWVTGNTLQLSTYTNNTLTARSVATYSGTVGTTRTLTVVALNGAYTATYGGATAAFTMPAAEYTGYRANTLAGVVFLGDNGVSRLDNFKVTK